MALGRAVAAWQHVEMALSRVFIKLLRCRGSEEVASAAFYTPRDFSLQLNMTRNVARWPAPGFTDTELGVLMEPEVCYGATEVYEGVQA
jgi:hypothetical protein